MDIRDSWHVINRKMLKYEEDFKIKWFPILDKMEYDDIIKLIAKYGKSKMLSKSFYIAFLIHSYLVFFRMKDEYPDIAMRNVVADVSFEMDYNNMYYDINYAEYMSDYFEDDGVLWDFEPFKVYRGCPDIE